jgi:phospholipid-transporting ATPase
VPLGDGANDVGMIHEARVGVGISGREGRHAANSADFAIGQFQFLVPLLLQHGRFNYVRCSNLVLFSFFKNLVLVSVLFYYCFYSGFSGTVPLDSFVLSGYNFYLGLPIIALGALDFDVSREDVMRFPKLAYNTGRLGEMLNNRNMLRWCTSAFVYGMVIYVVVIRYFTGRMNVNASSDKGGFLFMSGIGFANR